MNEENRNTITYDENWQSVADAEYPQIIEPNEDEEIIQKKGKKDKEKDYPKQHLLTFQLVVCLIIVILAFALKSIGGEIYTIVHDWYYSELNNSVIFEDDSKIDIDSLFGVSTSNEV